MLSICFKYLKNDSFSAKADSRILKVEETPEIIIPTTFPMTAFRFQRFLSQDHELVRIKLNLKCPDIQESTSPQYNPTSLDNIKCFSKQDFHKWCKDKLPLKQIITILELVKPRQCKHHPPFKLSRIGQSSWKKILFNSSFPGLGNMVRGGIYDCVGVACQLVRNDMLIGEGQIMAVICFCPKK